MRLTFQRAGDVESQDGELEVCKERCYVGNLIAPGNARCYVRVGRVRLDRESARALAAAILSLADDEVTSSVAALPWTERHD